MFDEECFDTRPVCFGGGGKCVWVGEMIELTGEMGVFLSDDIP